MPNTKKASFSSSSSFSQQRGQRTIISGTSAISQTCKKKFLPSLLKITVFFLLVQRKGKKINLISLQFSIAQFLTPSSFSYAKKKTSFLGGGGGLYFSPDFQMPTGEILFLKMHIFLFPIKIWRKEQKKKKLRAEKMKISLKLVLFLSFFTLPSIFLFHCTSGLVRNVMNRGGRICGST